MGYVHGLQGHLLPYNHSESVQKILKVRPISSTLWSVNNTHGVHCSGQSGQTGGFTEGYKNPPVPGRLVGLGQTPPNLSPAYTGSSNYLSGTKLTSQHGEIRAGPQTSFLLCRLRIRPERGQSQNHPIALADPYSKGR